jgi:isoleucyl-tRNA synthetase
VSASETDVRYGDLPASRPADDLERELIERWREEGLFARTVAAHEGNEPFVFFEGPPTANGRSRICSVVTGR